MDEKWSATQSGLVQAAEEAPGYAADGNLTGLVSSLMKVKTRKKWWKERENRHQLASEPRATYALSWGFNSPSQPNRLE